MLEHLTFELILCLIFLIVAVAQYEMWKFEAKKSERFQEYMNNAIARADRYESRYRTFLSGIVSERVRVRNIEKAKKATPKKRSR